MTNIARFQIANEAEQLEALGNFLSEDEESSTLKMFSHEHESPHEDNPHAIICSNCRERNFVWVSACECGGDIQKQVSNMYWTWEVQKRKELEAQKNRSQKLSKFTFTLGILPGLFLLMPSSFHVLAEFPPSSFQMVYTACFLVSISAMICSQYFAEQTRRCCKRMNKLTWSLFLFAEFEMPHKNKSRALQRKRGFRELLPKIVNWVRKVAKS